MEHYLPASVLDKIDQSSIKEELSKLHSSYYGVSEEEAEFEFLKVRASQGLLGAQPLSGPTACWECTVLTN